MDRTPLPGSARLADLGWHLPCRTIPSPGILAVPGCLDERVRYWSKSRSESDYCPLFQPGHLQGGAVAGEGGRRELTRIRSAGDAPPRRSELSGY